MFSAANLSTASEDTDLRADSPSFSSTQSRDRHFLLSNSPFSGKPPLSPYQCRKLRSKGSGITEISMTAMALLSPSSHQGRLIVKTPKLKHLKDYSQESSSFEYSEDGFTTLLKDNSAPSNDQMIRCSKENSAPSNDQLINCSNDNSSTPKEQLINYSKENVVVVKGVHTPSIDIRHSSPPTLDEVHHVRLVIREKM